MHFSLNNQPSSRHPFSLFELSLKNEPTPVSGTPCIGSIWLGVWRILSTAPKTNVFGHA
jgi:hypothetical protein